MCIRDRHITVPNFVTIGRSIAEILRFFEFSRWPPLPSWIFEISKFYCLFACRGSRRSSMPNFVKIGQLVAKILRIFYFSKWRPPPSWIFIFVKCYWLTVSGGPRRITVPNFVKIGRSIAEILQIFAAAILYFWNRIILLAVGVQRVETHQHVKFCQNRSIGCEDIKIFGFFKIAAVRHLGFIWGIFGPTTVSTLGSLSLCEIWYCYASGPSRHSQSIKLRQPLSRKIVKS